MSKQVYYTYSTVGVGATTGERFRALSPELGLSTSEPMRALRRYLSYRLPSGTSPQVSPEVAPVSLALIGTGYNTALIHSTYVGKDGAGRPGNFFTHAIIDPEIASTQDGTASPISASAAINLWKSSFWKTSENQISPRETELPNLTPQEISQLIATPGTLSLASIHQPYAHCPEGVQTVADWLPLVFSAFLMLKKLNKKQLYIAAPAEMVATFIWCIARCLPRTLTIMQELTFSTYESEITKSSATIAGTCWLQPTNHTGSFKPQTDLPNICYQPYPTNTVLAINCYTQRHTPFESDEQVKQLTQFVLQAFLQNTMADLDMLITQAEQMNCQNTDAFQELFRIRQEKPTAVVVQHVLTTPQLWSHLQYPRIQDKLIELMQDTQNADWHSWWRTQGWEQIQRLRKVALQQPQGEEASTLSMLTSRVMDELCNILADNQQGNEKWVIYWDRHLHSISNPAHDLMVWITLPQRLAQLGYTQTYQIWWQQSGKEMTHNLVLFAQQNSHREEYPQLMKALNHWWFQCAERIKQAWAQRQDREMRFWFEIISTIEPPGAGSQNWTVLLGDLDATLPPGMTPVDWCKWEIFKQYLVALHVVLAAQQEIPKRWLTMSWKQLPHIVALSDLPETWRKFAIAENIRQFQESTSSQILAYIGKCAPLVHEVLAELIQNDKEREQAVTFCVFLLQNGYASHSDELLMTILPVLFPYPKHQQRIASCANLSAEQLDEFVEKMLHRILSTQPDIPQWLMPRIDNFLTNFRLRMINPAEVTPEKRERISTILHILDNHNKSKKLPEQLQSQGANISCWYIINTFFDRPAFDPHKLRMLRNQINTLEISEEARQELKQEMLTFLSAHVETESDLVRVIDALAKVLLPTEHEALPAHVLLLKEMVRLYGKQRQSQSKTLMYIKVVLGETLNLLWLRIDLKECEQFLSACLDSLLAAIDAKVIQTEQWSPAIVKLWGSYLSQPKTNATGPLPIILSDPKAKSGNGLSQPSTKSTQPRITQRLSAITNTLTSGFDAVSGNNASQSSMPATNKTKNIFSVGVFNNVEVRLKKLREALISKKVDKIAEVYDESLDGYLSKSEVNIAKMAEKIVKAHKKIKAIKDINNFEASKDVQDFVKTYNKYHKEFIISDDIKKTVNWIIEEQNKRQME